MLSQSVRILAILACTTLTAAEDYVAHEWGTFTSFQGSDGQVIEWRSLKSSELPKFVYDRTRPAELFGQSPADRVNYKSATPSLQRMETPVIYFYPKQEMVVDVSVRFPDGLITEWFPQVRDFNPPASADLRSVIVKNGSLRWGKIRLFPESEHPELAKLIPEQTTEGKHYFAARETDAAYVRVGAVTGDEKFDHEKFLFYRGIGNFAAPLQVTVAEHGKTTLKNNGSDGIDKLFFLYVRKSGAGNAVYLNVVDGLKGDESKTLLNPSELADRLQLPRADMVLPKLGESLEGTLLSHGLYRREAAAMVKTWRESWFDEPGMRIFYILPQAWTERTLPLSLDPKPTELKRVMVGRVELMTPEMERELAKEVALLGSQDFDIRERASSAIKQLGRFTEPALKRVIDTSHDEEVKSRAKKLLEELNQPIVR